MTPTRLYPFVVTELRRMRVLGQYYLVRRVDGGWYVQADLREMAPTSTRVALVTRTAGGIEIEALP